jgi:hypothetical protein
VDAEQLVHGEHPDAAVGPRKKTAAGTPKVPIPPGGIARLDVAWRAVLGNFLFAVVAAFYDEIARLLGPPLSAMISKRRSPAGM